MEAPAPEVEVRGAEELDCSPMAKVTLKVYVVAPFVAVI